jgi:Glutaredoxin-like domain (DUF836)
VRKLILYSRPGCHLCEDVATQLEPLLRGRATLEIVDVDGSVALERRYGRRIPVLVDGDVELSAYPLDAERVARHLASF